MTRARWSVGLLLLAVAAMLPFGVSAQEAQRYSITGTVQQGGGAPLAGAQVSIRGTRQGAISDNQGRFTISAAVPAGRYTIEYSFIGRSTVTSDVNLGAERNVTLPAVTLEETALQLQEVVVTGPGAASERRALGNAVATVGAAQINRSPGTSSVGIALQGKIPGALITTANGQPGGAVTIRLRGNNSILGTAEPLVVVDGVIVDNATDALLSLSSNNTRGGSAMSNRLSDISPDDVERIEVLRGAAAAALYGSRAKNGVIQVITKRGVQGVARVSWGTQLEVSSTPKKYELNMAPTATAADIAIAPVLGLRRADGTALRVGDPVERFDYQDQIFRTGTGGNTQLSVSGGSGGTTYFLSGSYRDDQSIMRSADAQRYNVRGKLTQQVGERLDLTANANFIRSHVDFVSEGEQGTGVLTGIIFTPPVFNPAFNANLGRFPYNPVQGVNPYDVFQNWQAPEDVTRFVGNVDANYRFLDNLNVRYLFGFDDYRQESKLLQPQFAVSATSIGSIQNPVRLATSMNHDLTATLNSQASPSLGFNTLAGLRFTKQVTEVLRAAASDLPPGQELVGGAVQTASQSLTDLRTSSMFVQEQITIGQRLFLTAGLNYEASSAFGADQRWQMFPRIGASYVLNDEPFWRSTLGNTFSTMRLRAAYGQTGGQPPGLYDRFENYISTTFAGKPGLIASTTASNPNLKPERQSEIEVGFEAGVARDRAVLEFTYYTQKTTDLVLNVPLPSSSGFSLQRQNIGEVKNHGIEAALNTINYSSDNFTWRSRIGFAANRNKVTKMTTSNDTILVGYLNIVTPGQPIGVFYGGRYARGADGSVTYGNFTNANFPGRTLSLPLRMTDTLVVNGVTTTPFANGIIGDPNPDWTASLANTFSFGRNLDVSVLFDGRFGNDVANFTRRITEFFGADKNLEKEARGDTVPMTYGRNPAGRINIYEEYIEDGSFVKLRELALRYRIDAPFVRMLGATNMELSVAGRNLLTWTNYTGLDPEVNLFAANTVAQGVDFANTPLARTWVFGVNFSF